MAVRNVGGVVKVIIIPSENKVFEDVELPQVRIETVAKRRGRLVMNNDQLPMPTNVKRRKGI